MQACMAQVLSKLSSLDHLGKTTPAEFGDQCRVVTVTIRRCVLQRFLISRAEGRLSVRAGEPRLPTVLRLARSARRRQASPNRAAKTD